MLIATLRIPTDRAFVNEEWMFLSFFGIKVQIAKNKIGQFANGIWKKTASGNPEAAVLRFDEITARRAS